MAALQVAKTSWSSETVLSDKLRQGVLIIMVSTSFLLCATLIIHMCSGTVIIVAEDDLLDGSTLVEEEVMIRDEGLQAPVDSHFQYNDRPIIGVLSQELDDWLVAKLPPNHNYTAYIASSYIKWVEAGGARAVPVIIGRNKDYYEQLFAGLNGLLLPGGSAPLVGTGGFAEVGQFFFEMAKESTDAGDPFPIWGTCNGFELLTVLSSRDISRLASCNSEDQASPLHMLPPAPLSKVFGLAPPDVLRELQTERISINFHHFCLTPENFTRYGMEKFWNPLSVNWDMHGLKYISTIEAKEYPFVAVQFHPEKNIFEWSAREPRIPHTSSAVHVALYFAGHFVNMARRSRHYFPDRATEEKFLIYNYKPLYVGKIGVDWTFQEAYLF